VTNLASISKLPTNKANHQKPATPARLSLREARKAFTRKQICDAARELFFEQGYHQTTVDQIATVCGTYRATVYAYFADKEEILAAIADEYAEAMKKIIARFPAPSPSRMEIDVWVREMAAFASREQIPTILLTDLGNAFDAPKPMLQLGVALMEALAERSPAFRRALTPGRHQKLAFARAGMVLRELGWCCLRSSKRSEAANRESLLTVVAEAFELLIEKQG
jgi:AcrR family transcriptional regulator